MTTPPAAKLYLVDVFTCVPGEGNRAGVVFPAEGLDDAAMQTIATRVGASETAFVLAPDAADHDFRIRFFTPTMEVPSCGHATVAAHTVRTAALDLPAGEYCHGIAIGALRATVARSGVRCRTTIAQGRPRFGQAWDDARVARLLRALGLKEDERDSRCPVRVVDTGHSKVLLGLKRVRALDEIAPQWDSLTAILEEVPNGGCFVFTLEPVRPGILSHARMFAPHRGIPEDPVTGNGHGPLGAYLVTEGLVPITGDILRFRGRQGEAMGRPGEVDVEVTVVEGEPVAVRVTGDAVIVSSYPLARWLAQ